MNNRKLYYFSATWCGPCQAMKPIIAQIADDIIVVKCDVDESLELAHQFGVRSVPTFLIVENGVVTARAVGAMPLSKLKAFIGAA